MTIKVTSYITGRVVRVQCTEGDRVAEGQELLTLESMKMEMPIEAPRAGTVIKLHVAEGDSVLQGDTVATLATGDAT